MGGEGITKFIKRLAPDNINDLIASVALFRPGPLDSGAVLTIMSVQNEVNMNLLIFGVLMKF